jgi:hypothetical protein
MPLYKTLDNQIHYLDDPAHEYLLPAGVVPITDAEANAIRAADAPEPDPKLVGIEFEGVMCSATMYDQNGLLAVLTAYQLQGANFQPTRFEFANRNSLVITKDNIQAFIATWMPFRQSFFLPEL